jgi:RNA polymerase sigma-70 factor (ECF subfamily)
MWKSESDRQAFFTAQFNQNFEYVYAYVYARTAGNSQLTEDIVQETFDAAWLSLDGFKHKSAFRTWLCSIAKNKLKESYRRAIYRDRFELSDNADLSEHESSMNIEQAEMDKETRLCVRKVLNALRPLYRYALILKYVDGMSVKEIAKVLDKSAKAIDGVLQRAKAAFEKAYSEMEGCDRYDER